MFLLAVFAPRNVYWQTGWIWMQMYSGVEGKPQGQLPSQKHPVRSHGYLLQRKRNSLTRYTWKNFFCFLHWNFLSFRALLDNFKSPAHSQNFYFHRERTWFNLQFLFSLFAFGSPTRLVRWPNLELASDCFPVSGISVPVRRERVSELPVRQCAAVPEPDGRLRVRMSDRLDGQKLRHQYVFHSAFACKLNWKIFALVFIGRHQTSFGESNLLAEHLRRGDLGEEVGNSQCKQMPCGNYFLDRCENTWKDSPNTSSCSFSCIHSSSCQVPWINTPCSQS